MKYTGYQFDFTTAVHIGKQNLEDSEHRICADTLFSALCHEALLQGGEPLLDRLVKLAVGNGLRISDAFPFHGDTCYIPRPMMAVETERSGDSVLKKKLKKLECIPAHQLADYLQGTMDIEAESKIYGQMGTAEVRTMASVQEHEDAIPYSVGAYRFAENWGLYIILAYEEDTAGALLEELLTGLGYSGIGGKRSSGLGRFTLKKLSLSESLTSRLYCGAGEGTYMTLSVSMAEDPALESVLEDAGYSLLRRSGFISSHTYAQQLMKKQDFYLFKAGAVFKRGFEGIVEDVSHKGNHPVYRYAKPIFLEVR